jgi:opacity protein-like surface antigen
MKKFIASCLLLLSIQQIASAQEKENNDAFRQTKKQFGLKAGFNFLYLPTFKTSDQSFSSNTGFFVGGYYSLPAKRIGYRSEIIFSRQGYDYKTSTQSGSAKLDYIVLPQLMTMNITRFLQLHAGGQIALLLNAGVDSTANPSSTPSFERIKDYYTKLNYGFAGGVEIRPFAGLQVGGRYNLFFNFLSDAQSPPAYVPDYSGNLKNGLVQLYVGYQF